MWRLWATSAVILLSALRFGYGDVLGRSIRIDDFGAKGDGLSDDTDAINLALAEARGNVVTFSSGKVYRVRGAKADNTGGIGIASGAHLRGYGATVKLLDAQDAEVWQPCILRLRETEHVTVEGLTLDGNRDHNNPPMTDGDGGGNNIQLESARHTRLIGVVSRHASTDGLTATCSWSIRGGSKEPTDGLYVQRSVFTANNRQGLSVISLRHAVFEDTEFGKTGGKAPGAGIDFENDWPHQTIEDITFARCRMIDNRTLGIVFAVRRGIWARDIEFRDCDICGNGADEAVALRSTPEGGNMRRIAFRGGRVEGGSLLIGTPGLSVAQYEDIVIDGVRLGTNTWIRYDGVKLTGQERSLSLRNLVFRPSDRPPEEGMVVLKNCDGVEVANAVFPPGCASGIRLKGRVTALRIRDCVFDGRTRDGTGNAGMFFVRANPDLQVDKGLFIQGTRFQHSAWQALLVDGSGNWTVGADVIVSDCRGERQQRPSFSGTYLRLPPD